jgi:hypothetical protein
MNAGFVRLGLLANLDVLNKMYAEVPKLQKLQTYEPACLLPHRNPKGGRGVEWDRFCNWQCALRQDLPLSERVREGGREREEDLLSNVELASSPPLTMKYSPFPLSLLVCLPDNRPGIPGQETLRHGFSASRRSSWKAVLSRLRAVGGGSVG